MNEIEMKGYVLLSLITLTLTFILPLEPLARIALGTVGLVTLHYVLVSQER